MAVSISDMHSERSKPEQRHSEMKSADITGISKDI